MQISLKKLMNFFKQAEVVAELSPDEQTKVGSLLVDPTTHAILSSGYNGFCRGAPDNKLPKTRPEKYKFIVHSEVNLVLNCARHGIGTDSKIVVCTLSPCNNCVRFLHQAGIQTIYFKEKYRDFDENMKMPDLKLELFLVPIVDTGVSIKDRTFFYKMTIHRRA